MNDIEKLIRVKLTKEEYKEKLKEIIKTNKETYAISLKETDELIGIISADNIDENSKNYSLSYGIREKFRKQGYAYEAIYKFIDYYFKEKNMHRVRLGCLLDNIGSQKLYEKLGAKKEGIEREAKYYDNKFKDKTIYSILKSEWK